MIEACKASIARIFSHSGTSAIGAGFLVSEKHLFSCTHIVAQALGIPENTSEAPTDALYLDFPFAAPGHMLLAHVVCWRPRGNEHITVLELENILPDHVQCGPFILVEDIWKHGLQVFGFPTRRKAGQWPLDELQGGDSIHWIQMKDSRTIGIHIDADFSGMPVWDEQEGGIIGMVLAAGKHSKIKKAVIIPTLALLNTWPLLRRPILQTVKEYLQALMNHLAQMSTSLPPHLDVDRIHQHIRVIWTPIRSLEEIQSAFVAEHRDGYFEEEEYISHREGPAMYEQPKGDEKVAYWDRLRRQLKRAVIVGDPGIGKSWLLQSEGRQVVKEQMDILQQGEQIPDKLLLPIYLHLGMLAEELDRSELDIREAIVNIVRREFHVPEHSVFWIRQQLFRPRCLLLLDALDEVAEEQRAKLLEALKQLMRHSHCNILLTSRRVGYQGSSFALSNTTFKHVVELMAFDQKQVTGFIERWFATDKERKTKLLETIRQEPALSTFARLPLQLALLCQIASTSETIPTQRAKLCETILNRLLSPLGKQEQAQGQTESSQADTWTLLEYIAWHFATLHGHWRDLFPARECYQVAQEASWNPSLMALSISAHVLQRVSSEQDGHLRFLHSAFQEYLVARHLAHQPLAQWRKQVLAQCWSGSHWMRVMMLLAGCLQDPNPLLELLLSEPDDVFHTMLFLAGHCLAEANWGTVKQDLRERIVSELLIVLSSLSAQDRRQAAFVLGRLDVPLVTRLLPVLRNKDEHCLVRSLAVEVVQEIRHAEAEEDVRVTLQEMDNCKELRTMAAWALRRSSSSDAMNTLLTVLQDHNDYWEVRTAAAQALGVMSDPRTVNALFSTLQEDLHDNVYLITLHPAVVEALDQIGEPAIKGLLKALESKNRHVRTDAVKTLGVVGASEVVPELLIKLQDKHEHREVRIWLVWALGQLGDLRALSHLLAILLDKDEDLDVRSTAIWALGQLGDPQAVEALITLLQHKSRELRGSAAGTLWLLGDSRAVVELVRVLQNKKAYWEIHVAAIQSLGDLTDARAVPELVAILQGKASHWEVQGEAALALGKLGDARAIDPLLVAAQNEGEYAAEIVEALGRLGDARAIDPLLTALHSPRNPGIREKAAEALGRIGGSRAVEALLKKLLNIGEFHSAFLAVIEALGQIGDLGTAQALLKALQHVKQRRPEVSTDLSNVLTGKDLLVAGLSEYEDTRWNASRAMLFSQFHDLKAVDDFLLRGWNDNAWVRKKEVREVQRATVRALEKLIQIANPIDLCELLLEFWLYQARDEEEQVLLYELLAHLGPRLCAAVGEAWPAWRSRIIRITNQIQSMQLKRVDEF